MANAILYKTPTGEVVIGEDNWQEFAGDPLVNGDKKKRGLVPRVLNASNIDQAGIKYDAVQMDVYPESEWSERLAAKIRTESQLSDIRKRKGPGGGPIPSTDQNGRGYCWFHSGTSALLLVRALQNEEYVELSAYSGACKIKNFRDEGGWGAQGLDFLMKYGVADANHWPQRAVARHYDNPETWANALKYRFTEGYIDIQAAQYDRRLSREQVATCLLNNIPVIADYNWWGHSVCAMDLVDGLSMRNTVRAASGKLFSLQEFDRFWVMNEVGGRFGTRIWNSWGDNWSENGTGILAPTKAWPDGATAPRVAIAA